MPYQNVGTPRFYISKAEWLNSNGDIVIPPISCVNNLCPGLFNTLPVIPQPLDPVTTSSMGILLHRPIDVYENGFVAILGHNIKDGGRFQIYESAESGQTPVMAHGVESVVNGDTDGSLITPQYQGFSIVTHVAQQVRGVWFEGQNENEGSVRLPNVGSIIIGSYYDMPHSPELNLTLTREYEGISTIETRGGSTLTNNSYIRAAKWGNTEAWSLNTGTPHAPRLASSGRRIWDLSFRHIQDSDIFPEIGGIEPYEYTNAAGTDVFSSGD